MKRSEDRRKLDGAWILALRKELDLSQGDFADRLGVSRSAVARWELNAFRPTKLAANALLQFATTVRSEQKTKS